MRGAGLAVTVLGVVPLCTVLVLLLPGVVECQKDYYKTLGLTKGATEQEIKKAFRKLALKYHPDKSSEPDAVDKFREVAEAYETLRDPERRRQYESMGHDSFFHANTGFNPGNFDFKDLFKDFDDLFKEFGDMEDLMKQHFGNHKIQTEMHGGRFDFGEDIEFGNLFDGMDPSNMHDHLNQNAETILEKVKVTEQDGKKCRTVTERKGNSVTTFTKCSSSSSSETQENPHLHHHHQHLHNLHHNHQQHNQHFNIDEL